MRSLSARRTTGRRPDGPHGPTHHTPHTRCAEPSSISIDASPESLNSPRQPGHANDNQSIDAHTLIGESNPMVDRLASCLGCCVRWAAGQPTPPLLTPLIARTRSTPHTSHPLSSIDITRTGGQGNRQAGRQAGKEGSQAKWTGRLHHQEGRAAAVAVVVVVRAAAGAAGDGSRQVSH